MMAQVADKKKEIKYKSYMKICEKFQPVMHKFFFEKFHDSCSWFNARLNYGRSLATISMAGYIVGLGDRHTQNILIDEQTAELIQIDLGIAFDQVTIDSDFEKYLCFKALSILKTFLFSIHRNKCLSIQLV
jgi:ataxia telangiectasia mutated family protein